MSSYSYELSLFGEFFAQDLKAVLNRIAMHSESARPMHSREIVFEPEDIQQQRNAGQEPALLRARKELLEPESGWYVTAHNSSSADRTADVDARSGCCIHI